MAVDIDSDDGLRIRGLVPLATIPGAIFSALCADMTIESVSNQALFKRGDTDAHLIYLLAGEVVLQADGLVIETISDHSEAAKFALAHQIPRKIDAVAKGTVRFVKLDADKVNNLPPIEYDEDCDNMIVDEPEENADDWMTALLKLPVFQRLPPANLQKILIGLENVDYDQGTVIIEQGGEGDYYYLLKKGQCLVTRKPSSNAKEIKLAVLDKGETFGEDALITGNSRTVSITALTDVSVLRLGKKMFVSLIKEPSIKYLNYEAMQEAKKKGAVLIDIRTPDEFEKRHLEGSVNFPYFSLRMQLKTLNREKMAVIICSDGKASEAAAFLLLKNKYNALVLKGGMESISLENSKGSAEFVIDDGIETLVEIHQSELVGSEDLNEESRPEDSKSDNWVMQIDQLKANAEELQKANDQLTQRCQQLENEKIELEKKLQSLMAKSES